jgi:O-antigen/teichoic acid export membrane protein
MKFVFTKILKKITKSNLVKDSVSYTFLNVTEKAIPFLILPIITRVLSKEEVGLYIIYQAIIEILIPALTLNIGSSVLLNYYKVEKEEFKKYLSNGLLLFLPIFIFSTILIYIYNEPISQWTNFPANWLNILCFIVFARFITELRQNIWRVEYKIKKYGYFTIGISVIKNGLGLVFLFFTSLGWEGLILGHLIGYWLFAGIACYTFIKEKLLQFSLVPSYIKDAFLVGYPLALHKLGLWAGNAANRVIIAGVLGTAATGSYGIGASFAVLVTVVEDAFNKAYVPYLFDRLKEIDKHEKSEIVKLSYYVYIFLILITVVFFIIGYFCVGFIFGIEYLSTREFILPLLLAAMFKGFYKLHVNYIMFTKKTLNITQITISTGIINIVLAYFMTLGYGIIGAAYSLLIMSILQYILTFYVGNKLIPMPWFKSYNK